MDWIKQVYFSLVFLVMITHMIIGQEKTLSNPVFVFNNAFNQRDYNYPQVAELLAQLGYDGIEHRETKGLFELKDALEKKGLSLFTDYVKLDIDAEMPYDPVWKEVIPQWTGNDLILWVHIHSEKYRPSDPASDAEVVPVLQELADLAKPHNIRIAVYPHHNFVAETPEDGFRLANLTDRDNVGTVFNLCHFLKTDKEENIEKVIEQVLPKLFAVSISGADRGNTNTMKWDQLIQPLGEGTFDVYKVVKILVDQGYTGPIGFQCYQIPGNPEVFLKSSMDTWTRFKRLYEEGVNTLTLKEKKEGWKLLFDGYSSWGWRSISNNNFPKQGWNIQDGEIRIGSAEQESSQAGDIITESQFSDFELVWQWKMETKGGNSGIKYYVNPSLTTDGKYGYGLEYQILDDQNHPWMLEGKMKPNDFHTCGALYEFFAPSPKKEVAPLGAWNTSRIRSRNHRVEHWLNGKKVLKYKRGGKAFQKMLAKSKFKEIDQFGTWPSGHILIQDHSSNVSFRGIKIREL